MKRRCMHIGESERSDDRALRRLLYTCARARFSDASKTYNGNGQKRFFEICNAEDVLIVGVFAFPNGITQ